jgi:hypothetical protein
MSLNYPTFKWGDEDERLKPGNQSNKSPGTPSATVVAASGGLHQRWPNIRLERIVKQKAAKTVFGTTFHSPDVEAAQYGMAKWNKPARLQLYS